MYDLNDLIPPVSGYELAAAMGINDRGQIAVDAVLPDRRDRAVLLTPVQNSADAGRARTLM